jgi:hypothetical protein
VLVKRAQLAEIKKRVAAGKEPQKTAFEALKASKLGAIDYTPHPRETVECGSNSRPDLGCKDEQADSEAAYAQALLWAITGDEVYAAPFALRTRVQHTKGANQRRERAQKRAGPSRFPRAGDHSLRLLVSDADIARFQNMLTKAATSYSRDPREPQAANPWRGAGEHRRLNDNRVVFDHGITM